MTFFQVEFTMAAHMKESPTGQFVTLNGSESRGEQSKNDWGVATWWKIVESNGVPPVEWYHAKPGPLWAARTHLVTFTFSKYQLRHGFVSLQRRMPGDSSAPDMWIFFSTRLVTGTRGWVGHVVLGSGNRNAASEEWRQ